MSEDVAPVVETDLRAHMARTVETAVYPFAGLGSVQGLMYVALGLSGEAGEVANQIKKIARDDGAVVSVERRGKIHDELGDVLWYVLRLCYEMGFDPYEVLDANRTKLTMRAANGTLNGDGQHRGSRSRQASVEWEADLAEAAGKEDVFAVPLEAYEKLINVRTSYDGLRLKSYAVTCTSLRCVTWNPHWEPTTPAGDIQRDAMTHIMAEHTPWGRAGRG
jgi:NTP pyrophosphatase (non-canonical NTP hydrolase)